MFAFYFSNEQDPTKCCLDGKAIIILYHLEPTYTITSFTLCVWAYLAKQAYWFVQHFLSWLLLDGSRLKNQLKRQCFHPVLFFPHWRRSVQCSSMWTHSCDAVCEELCEHHSCDSFSRHHHGQGRSTILMCSGSQEETNYSCKWKIASCDENHYLLRTIQLSFGSHDISSYYVPLSGPPSLFSTIFLVLNCFNFVGSCL